MRLGLTLPLLPMETLPSFVSYIAQRNGLRHVQDFVQDMDLSWRQILQLDPGTVQDLAELTGVDAEALAADSFAPVSDGFFRFRGRDLPLSFLNRSALKYCPLCVSNDRDVHGRTWGRALWQLHPLHVCPAHGVMLDVLAPPDYPRCPHDFAGRIADHWALINAVAALDVGREATRFARYLSERLHGHDPRNGASWLDGLPLDVAARLCENVGTLVIAGPNSHPKALDRRRMIEAGAVGFAISVKGLDALRDVYESVRRRSPSSKGGFYADFGFYTRWLLQRMAQPERYRQVLDHFRDFMLDSYPVALGQEILGRTCTRRRWFTWAEIGRKYGLSSGRVARFQRALGISGDDLRRVAPAAYDTELSILSRGLDRKQAAHRLNLHPSGIDKLVAAGLLNHALVLPQMDKLFLPEDIDSFLTAVFANAAMVETSPAGAWPLRNIAHKAALPNAALLRAVISGRLENVWRLRAISGLPALHPDLDEVLDAFESPPLIGLTRDDLRRQLHINCSTVSLLLKSSMIASRQFPHPRTRQPLSLIAAEDLDRFLDLHLPLGLMAWQLGTQAKHVAARLDRAEVWPILLPERCSKIYLRGKAAPVIAI
ncbi:TniQ family protein [Paracoccus pacificus]|uniref:TniQ family protein n=1 Tax=Paracoccus pacificus TaxID=1463598 RepID=A0ABW4R362_9RHOB